MKKKKDKSSPAGSVRNISGKNVVGVINAEGSAQVHINQVSYNQLSEVEEERERQKAELDVLQKAIRQKYEDLHKRINAPVPTVGNPYLFLQSFGFSDRARFFGRDNETAELFERVTYGTVTFLSGNRAIGKTSLMKAGLVPLLRVQGHLPLMVSVGSEALEDNIKKELLPNLNGMQFMKNMPLTEFIRLVTSALPEGSLLVVIVDDFEEFFNDREHAESEQDAFLNEWKRCFNGATPRAHWLFCVPSNFQHLLNYFKREVQPNPNTISVPPLSRVAAREAILKPAETRDIKVDEDVVISILDTLGGNNIDPADLQLVCYMLAGGKDVSAKIWTMAYYTEQGKADGILRDYLDRTIEELEPKEREPAWQVLAVLADPAIETSTEEQLVEKMNLYGVEESITRHVLTDLQSSNLIERAAAFKLTNDTLRPRIEKWKEARSARERAREEAREQLQSIRNSALRGLLGGAVGFVVFDKIIFRAPIPDFSFLFFNILLDIAVGSLAGFMVVFAVDVSVASYSGPRRWFTYLTGALGGALSFALAVMTYSNLNYLGEDVFLSVIPRALLEGGLWGAVAGMGIAWTLKAQRSLLITIPVSVIMSGLMLGLADLFFGVLRNAVPITKSLILIGLAGAALPGFILAAALAGRRKNRS